jgi:hypothetical protein
MSPTKQIFSSGSQTILVAGRVAADKDQLDAPPAIEQRRPLCKGDVRGNDEDVVELILDFRLALETVAHALLEILGVARHLLVGALMRQHLHRHEVLVAQRVAAVVIGVDQIQERRVGKFLLDLGAPVDRLRRNQRCVDQDDALFGVDEPWGASAIVRVDKNAGRQLFALTEPCNPDPDCASASGHDTLSVASRRCWPGELTRHILLGPPSVPGFNKMSVKTHCILCTLATERQLNL